MVVGAKMAFGCALGGSILGFTGGRALQRRGSPKDDTVVEVELKDLSTKSTLHSLKYPPPPSVPFPPSQELHSNSALQGVVNGFHFFLVGCSC
uniref:Uncharacterized protein n=2 Tax=Ixodes ricinus TaxID=34613 RepID=V5GHT4_IXORI